MLASFQPTPHLASHHFLIIGREPAGTMAVGHTFTIEPMICEGAAAVLHWPDNWTATTKVQ